MEYITKQLTIELAGGSNWVEFVKWSFDGKYLATTSGKFLKIWTKEGSLVSEYKDVDSTITGICWKKDSSELIISGYGGIKFLKPQSATPHQIFAWKNSMISLSWSPDEKFIGAGTQDAKVHFWEVPYIQNSDFEMTGYPGKIRAMSWDSTSDYFALSSLEQIVVWKFAGKPPLGAAPLDLNGHTHKVTQLLFQNNHKVLASGDISGKVLYWYVGHLNFPFAESQTNSEITFMTWSHDDAELAVGTKDGELIVFEMESLIG